MRHDSSGRFSFWYNTYLIIGKPAQTVEMWICDGVTWAPCLSQVGCIKQLQLIKIESRYPPHTFTPVTLLFPLK